MTNLHGKENLVLPLELDQNRNEIGLEQARDMGAHEPVESERVGPEPLELLGHDQTLLAYLLLPPPYREARARPRTPRLKMKMVREQEIS